MRMGYMLVHKILSYSYHKNDLQIDFYIYTAPSPHHTLLTDLLQVDYNYKMRTQVDCSQSNHNSQSCSWYIWGRSHSVYSYTDPMIYDMIHHCLWFLSRCKSMLHTHQDLLQITYNIPVYILYIADLQHMSYMYTGQQQHQQLNHPIKRKIYHMISTLRAQMNS